jgi:hypothetical protein
VRNDPTLDIYRALCTLSEIEQQLLHLRDQLTALLVGTNVHDKQREASSTMSGNVPCVVEKPARETVATVAVAEPAGIDLEQWLNDRGIKIKQKRTDIAFDPTFDRLAKRLGDHYESLFTLYAAIKRRYGALLPRSISLQELAPQHIGSVVNFGNELLRNSFLKEFRYDRKQRAVYFEPQENGQVQNFFTGGWFERYVFLRAKEYLASSQRASEIAVLLNPKVVLPDSQDFELDILIGTSSVVLWLECKTGKDYPAYTVRYQEIATKYMRMSPLHRALVLLEPLTDEQKHNSSNVAGMAVLNLPDLGCFFDNAV